MIDAVDKDQDLLDELDRQQGLGTLPITMLVGGLAALAAAVVYFTLKMQLSLSGEIAADTAILTFIVSAVLLGIS